ncbi:MAG: ferrous iron transporter B [Eubacteriales bacterium]
MSCCENILSIEDDKLSAIPNKILLIGNPNVGKSVIFTGLSGKHVMSSNFAGTTVSYTKAKITLGEKEYNLIDVPGTYSLEATSEAEAVAVSFMKSDAKAVICVLDATNLTRNLNLAFEVLSYNIPVIFSLNLVDIAVRKGMQIATTILAEELNAPVINTVAVKGEGFQEIKDALLAVIKAEPDCSSCDACTGKKALPVPISKKEMWGRSEHITKKCISHTGQSLKFIDKLGHNMVKPFPGIPIATLIMLVSLVLIVFGGKGLRAAIFIPIVSGLIIPFFQNIIGGLALPIVLENILIGEYGVFVIGFEWPLSLILPYVTLFYIVFTFLEDCGFLPRMAVLFDNIMRKMGVQGGSMISMIMGYGCAVPAIIGTRVATTRKERIMITSMVCFAVPCISQSAAFIALFADYSFLLLIALFILSFAIIFMVGLITGKLLKGKVEPIIIEIPHLLLPEKKAYFKKLTIRLKEFLFEAEGPMLIAVVVAAIFTESGMLNSIAYFFKPLVSGFLGLPEEAVLSLLLGIIRREMSIAPLLNANLNGLQMFVGATVSLLYLPCLSVFGIIAKEFNAKVALAIGMGTVITSFLLGGLINFIGQLFL